MNTPFRQLCALWCDKIGRAAQFKEEVFGKAAEEAMRFLTSHHDFLYEEQYARASSGFKYMPDEDQGSLARPSFCMTVNKVAELRDLFGPVLYHRNPVRIVRPREYWVPPISLAVGPPPPLEQIEANPELGLRFQQAMFSYQGFLQQAAMEREQNLARAQLMEAYLNYTPNETGLKESVRLCIDEGLIKGRGVIWTEWWQPPAANYKIIRSSYETVDYLNTDPDMESVGDSQWISRKCIHPVWKVEQIYGWPSGSLKGNLESLHRGSQASAGSDAENWSRKHGTSNDLIQYHKVYSKMGMGGRLTGGTPELQKIFEGFSDYCYLVVAKDIPFPLNLPPQLVEAAETGDPQAQQQLLSNLAWPTPFWADGEWPFTELDFHTVPRRSWPQSHIHPAMGFQKFLDWAYSSLAGKVRNNSRDFIAILKSAGEEVKQSILNGSDMTLLEIEALNKNISEVVQFLQHPPMNRDVMEVVQMIDKAFERATGVTEMLSVGASKHQFRSAEEAAIKNELASIRPDDMAERVEHLATRLARKEGLAARFHLRAQDVAPILGMHAASFWDQLMAHDDPTQAARELDYRIESGTTRKPNKDRDIQNTGEAAQVFLPILVQWSMSTGNVRALNAFLRDWAKARDLDPAEYILEPPPVPAPEPSNDNPPTKEPVNP